MSRENGPATVLLNNYTHNSEDEHTLQVSDRQLSRSPVTKRQPPPGSPVPSGKNTTDVKNIASDRKGVVMEDGYPGALLQQAAIFNNVELIGSLLEGPEEKNINAPDSFGRTALYTSISNESYECSRLLLTKGGESSTW